MKASDLIRDALQELGQLAAEQPITADQYATGVRYANRMFSSFSYLGLGFTVLLNASETVTIPSFADEWAVKSLAVRMASQYAAFDGLQDLKMDARTAYNEMIKNLDFDYSTSYPSGLPVGLAVENDFGVDAFYPNDDEAILSESGNFIAVE